MDKKTAEKIFEKKKFLARGKRGFVYVSEYYGKKYLVKEKNPLSEASSTIFFEAEFNKKMNEVLVGPKFLYCDGKTGFVIREFVEGLGISDWIDLHSSEGSFRDSIYFILVDLLNQCRRMDSVGINKMEMNNPYKDVVIDSKFRPWIIDFERCRLSKKPKNVTQFCQFLSFGSFSSKLRSAGIIFDTDKVMELTKRYKEDPSEKNFVKIKKYFESAFFPKRNAKR